MSLLYRNDQILEVSLGSSFALVFGWGIFGVLFVVWFWVFFTFMSTAYSRLYMACTSLLRLVSADSEGREVQRRQGRRQFEELHFNLIHTRLAISWKYICKRKKKKKDQYWLQLECKSYLKGLLSRFVCFS